MATGSISNKKSFTLISAEPQKPAYAVAVEWTENNHHVTNMTICRIKVASAGKALSLNDKGQVIENDNPSMFTTQEEQKFKDAAIHILDANINDAENSHLASIAQRTAAVRAYYILNPTGN